MRKPGLKTSGPHVLLPYECEVAHIDDTVGNGIVRCPETAECCGTRFNTEHLTQVVRVCVLAKTCFFFRGVWIVFAGPRRISIP